MPREQTLSTSNGLNVWKSRAGGVVRANRGATTILVANDAHLAVCPNRRSSITGSSPATLNVDMPLATLIPPSSSANAPSNYPCICMRPSRSRESERERHTTKYGAIQSEQSICVSNLFVNLCVNVKLNRLLMLFVSVCVYLFLLLCLQCVPRKRNVTFWADWLIFHSPIGGTDNRPTNRFHLQGIWQIPSWFWTWNMEVRSPCRRRSHSLLLADNMVFIARIRPTHISFSKGIWPRSGSNIAFRCIAFLENTL